MNLPRTFLACALAAVAGGCTATSTFVTESEAAGFNRCVTNVANGLKSSLYGIQSVEIANRVDAYARGTQRTIERVDIDPKLSDAVVRVITEQLDFLAKYSEALKDATTPGTSWGKSVSGINAAESKLMGDAQSLDNKVSGRAVISDANVSTFNTDAGGVAKAVSSIGEGALTLYGEEKAAKIAGVVNPDIQKYCASLESLLTDDPDSKAPGTGLAGILIADYEERIASVKYLATTAVPPTGPDDTNYLALVRQRRAILEEYAALVRNEKAALARVLALRKAVAEIAAAHEALSHKDDATFKEKLSNVEELVRSVSSSGDSNPPDSSK
jgi:hypothetical protein